MPAMKVLQSCNYCLNVAGAARSYKNWTHKQAVGSWSLEISLSSKMKSYCVSFACTVGETCASNLSTCLTNKPCFIIIQLLV